jgi:hypothetical protein
MHVAGLALRGNDGALVRTSPRARVRSIDDLPWPAWHLVPTLSMYLDNHFGFEEQNRRAIPMIATRGCPYRCTFCSSPSMWGTSWYARDPRDVIEEIKFYLERYRIEHVEFYDLTAVVDRHWTLEFTRLLREERLSVTWRLPSGTRTEALDEDVLAAMRASGCEAIVYAPESGSPRTLARIKKMVKPDRMLRSARAAVGTGMHVRANFIMGMPGQTPGEIVETFAFMAKLAWVGVHDANAYYFYPYPGSELYRQLVEQGKIDPDSPSYDELLAGACFTDFKTVRSWSEFFSPAALRLLCLSAMGMFYAISFMKRPSRPLNVIWRIVTERPFTWLERFVYGGLRQYILGRKISRLAKTAATTREQAAVRVAPPALTPRCRAQSLARAGRGPVAAVELADASDAA